MLFLFLVIQYFAIIELSNFHIVLFHRFKLRMRGLQVDNQLPLTPMPVLFRPQRVGEENDYIFKFSLTMQSNGSLDLCAYPYIGVQVSMLYFKMSCTNIHFIYRSIIFILVATKQGPENSAFLINIHEPIIWRLHEMIQQVNLHILYDSQKTAVSVDSIIQIGYARTFLQICP